MDFERVNFFLKKTTEFENIRGRSVYQHYVGSEVSLELSENETMSIVG